MLIECVPSPSQPIVFARFMIPTLLPDTIDRVIYLDQDVIVLQDLAPLWDTDLEGKPLAAARLCRDSALWRKQFKMGKDHLVQGGYDHDTCTLNNGVLVYDLEMWRQRADSEETSYTDELFMWSQRNSADQLYSLGSQPPFNLVFYRNYKVLDDMWNLMDVSGLREETEHGLGLPWTRHRDEVNGAGVVHWNGLLKPWSCAGEGNYAELWTQFFPDYQDHLGPDFEQDAACAAAVVTDVAAPASVEQFTVVIVAFARIDTLIKIAKHLEHSRYIKEILVAWNNQDVPCPQEVSDLPWVRCLQQEANLVHNRFGIWNEVSTEAVLHYDDDLVAPIEDLEAAFQIWRKHRDQVLGFEPRVVVCDEPAGCQYKFRLHDGHFDLVIGKLFMVSKHYMEAYFQHAGLVQLSSVAPCEDLAMSFLVGHAPPLSHITARGERCPHASEWTVPSLEPRAPLLFKSNLTEISSKMYAGLSQGIDSTAWRNMRHDCIAHLVDLFDGETPGKQFSYYERDPVRRRVYKLPVYGRLPDGWCSDKFGSRVCRQP